MARIFTDAGLKVSIFDAKSGPIPWPEAARAEVVVIAVPIPAIEDVVKNLGPHTREDGVVIDIASLKEAPLKTMLAHCRGEVIGSHPLFGPNIDSFQGYTFFLCPARSEKWVTWFSSFLENLGASPVVIDPARHDRLMARIQVLRHMFLFCFGRSLMRLEFDVDKDAPLSGPWFSELINQLNRQLDQGADLFADLALFNPEADRVFDEFFRAADEVAESFSSGDRSRIVGLINEVSSYMRPACQAERV